MLSIHGFYLSLLTIELQIFFVGLIIWNKLLLVYHIHNYHKLIPTTTKWVYLYKSQSNTLSH